MDEPRSKQPRWRVVTIATIFALSVTGASRVTLAQAQEEQEDATQAEENHTEASDPEGGPNWGAIVSFGVAGIAAGLMLGSLAAVGSADDGLIPYRVRVGQELAARGVPSDVIRSVDACVEMETLVSTDPSYQRGLDICSQASTWQALSYVFLWLSASAIITGIVFLVVGSGDDGTPNTISLTPSFGPDGASLTGRMTF